VEDTSIWDSILKILHREQKVDFSNTVCDAFLRFVYHTTCLSLAWEKRRPAEGSCLANVKCSFSREHPREEMAQKVSLPFSRPGAAREWADILVPGKKRVAASVPSSQGKLGSC